MNISYEVIVADVTSAPADNYLVSGGHTGSSGDIDTSRFVIEGVLLSFVAFIGLIGNLLALIILFHPKMQSSMNYMLQGLVVYDTLLLITSFLNFGLLALGRRTGLLKHYTKNIYPSAKPILLPLAYIAHTGSIWSTVGVTIERYLIVCHALMPTCLRTFLRAVILNIIIAVFVIAYNMPSFWEWERIETTHPVRNTTVCKTVPTEFAHSWFYSVVYLGWLDSLVLHFIPYSILIVLNTSICRKVRNSKNPCPQERRNNRLARMLFCIVAVFFLCNILAFVHKILGYLNIYEVHIPIITNLLITVNSAANCIIYYWFSPKFRRRFLLTFCNYRPSAVDPTSSSERSMFSVIFKKQDSAVSITQLDGKGTT